MRRIYFMNEKVNSSLAKVPIREKAAMESHLRAANIITQILGMFLTSYLTDSVGVAVAAVGTMMLLREF